MRLGGLRRGRRERRAGAGAGRARRHQARGPLRDRPQHPRRVRPRPAQGGPDHPLAEGRGAGGGGPPLLAGRQAALPLRRRRLHLRHGRAQGRGHVGDLAAPRRTASAASTWARRRRATRSPASSPASSTSTIPCSTGRSWASPASTSWARRWISGPWARPGPCGASPSPPGARRATRCSTRSATTRSGPSTSRAGGWRSEPPSPDGPRMELSRQLERARCSTSSGAGNTIDLYDAATHRYLRTVTFDSEFSLALRVPARALTPAGVAPPAPVGLALRQAASAPARRRPPPEPREHPPRPLRPPALPRPRGSRDAGPRRAASSCASWALFLGLTVAGFALNVGSGLLYTRASAEALFAMRLDVYRHLQRLSPRFYARTPLGEVVSRLNNDVSEVQRVAAETVLASVGNVLFLAGTLAMLAWLAPRLLLVGLALPAPEPVGAPALPPAADLARGGAPPAQRRHRELPHRDPAGHAPRGDRERAGARGRSLPREERVVRGARSCRCSS